MVLNAKSAAGEEAFFSRGSTQSCTHRAQILPRVYLQERKFEGRQHSAQEHQQRRPHRVEERWAAHAAIITMLTILAQIGKGAGVRGLEVGTFRYEIAGLRSDGLDGALIAEQQATICSPDG